MRAARLAVLGLFVPSLAAADVYQNRVLECPPGEMGLARLTSSSRVLYVNDCLPNGCVVKKGNADSAITDTSSLATGTVTMAAWSHGPEAFDRVFACVQEKFAPFDITVVKDDPGAAPHFEVMAAGTPAQLNATITGAGGIAPFIGCNAQRDSVLAFVFAGLTADEEYLCTAIAHEAGHTYGLSHSLDGLDPMTYMDLNAPKAWQNSEQTCGTSTPENCRCFPDTQNSFRYLAATFGLNPNLAENTIEITRPREGAYVKAGFPVSASWSSPLLLLSGGLSIDNGTTQPAPNDLFAWNAPTTIAAGKHTVAVTATDFADRVATQSVSVTVMSTCSATTACAGGTVCLGGTCYPTEEVDGGLGAACEGNDDCATGLCASDASSSHCTAACDPGNTCPSGFECLTDAAVCWPTEDGGCMASGGSPSLLVGVGLGLGLLLRRRRARV